MARGKNALSVRGIRGAARRRRREQPLFDASLSTAVLVFPIQIVALVVGGAGWVLSVAVAFGVSLVGLVGLALGGGMLQGLSVRHPDAWAAAGVLGACGYGWYLVGGPGPAAALTVVTVGMAAHFFRRRNIELREETRRAALPDDVVDRIAALPSSMAADLRGPLDRGLSAHASLVKLLRSDEAAAASVDIDAIVTDAATCVRRIVEHTETSIRLRDVAPRTPKIEAAQRELGEQIESLVESLTAAVEGAATYAAVGERSAARELAAQAEHLHLVAQSLAELEQEH